MNFEHTSVLLKECIDGLNIKRDGIYADGTLGGAGHSKEIVKHLKEGLLIGIDQDPNAIQKAQDELKDFLDNVVLVHNNFSNIKSILEELKIKSIDGMILDLGVSSHQLDSADRGFSYNKDAPLDMRMNPNQKVSAWDIVNNYPKNELLSIIRRYGEEKWASRITDFIVREREANTIDTTLELVDVIKKAIPYGARRDGPHPAKRTFQAIRIEVNQELDILKDAVVDIVKALKPSGRICIITFHSLEDRIVKQTLKELSLDCICPIQYPICQCNKQRNIKIITRKPITPSKDEILNNPRSRSAKLRIAEKV